MSSINSVRKLQILYFSKKNKKIKNLKNREKSGPISAFIYITLVNLEKTISYKGLSQLTLISFQ